MTSSNEKVCRLTDQRWLQDILDHADELVHIIGDQDVDAFASDNRTRRATERLLTIIGEAAKRLSDTAKRAIDQPWQDIIRFRDRGVHHYDSLSAKMLHEIATIWVPGLADAVRRHLQRNV